MLTALTFFRAPRAGPGHAERDAVQQPGVQQPGLRPAAGCTPLAAAGAQPAARCDTALLRACPPWHCAAAGRHAHAPEGMLAADARCTAVKSAEHKHGPDISSWTALRTTAAGLARPAAALRLIRPRARPPGLAPAGACHGRRARLARASLHHAGPARGRGRRRQHRRRIPGGGVLGHDGRQPARRRCAPAARGAYAGPYGRRVLARMRRVVVAARQPSGHAILADSAAAVGLCAECLARGGLCLLLQGGAPVLAAGAASAVPAQPAAARRRTRGVRNACPALTVRAPCAAQACRWCRCAASCLRRTPSTRRWARPTRRSTPSRGRTSLSRCSSACPACPP